MMLNSHIGRAPRVGRSKSSNSLPFIHILILSSAFLSAVLRLNQDSDITIFRAMIPLVAMFVLIYDRKKTLYLIAILFYLAFCQIISFYMTPYNFNFYNIAFFLNYIAMIILGFYIYILDNRFNRRSIDNFFSIYFYFLILSMVAQYVFDFTLPNIPDAGDALNSWYGNENDASLALAAFIFYAARFGMLRRHAVGAIAAVVIMDQNGSRTCMLSVAILMYYLVVKRFGFTISAYLTVFLAILLVGYIEFFIQGFDIVAEVSDFMSSFVAALENFFELKIIAGVISSLDVRSVAAALAFMDFVNHPLFGIGAGNTISLIEQNGSIFNYVIKSTHNMPLMMLAELGLFGIAAFLYPIFRISKLKTWNFLFWMFLYLFSSLSQSGGFMTNFFVLVTFVLVIARPETVEQSKKQLPARRRKAQAS